MRDRFPVCRAQSRGRCVTFRTVVNTVALRNGVDSPRSPAQRTGNGMHIIFMAQSLHRRGHCFAVIAGILRIAVYDDRVPQYYAGSISASAATRRFSALYFSVKRNRSQPSAFLPPRAKRRAEPSRSPDPICNSVYIARVPSSSTPVSIWHVIDARKRGHQLYTVRRGPFAV